MAVNNMSVGKDYSFAYYDTDSGQVVDLGDVQSISITAQKHDIKSMPYNDVPRYGYIPDGYKVSFSVTRTDSTLEDFQLAANTRFNAGNSTRAGYLNEVVHNPDGTYSRYQYTGFVFWVTDIGEISREKNISIKAEGWASDKVKIA